MGIHKGEYTLAYREECRDCLMCRGTNCIILLDTTIGGETCSFHASKERVQQDVDTLKKRIDQGFVTEEMRKRYGC